LLGLAGEFPISFACAGDQLVGILHLPSPSPQAGVVLVVGGPQYRTGSHRQFTLLARELAAHGVAVLRFDCRGMGDSDGQFPGFEHIEPDVAAAVAAIFTRVPTLTKVALWGLCDATLAMCSHARRDPRIAGVVLLNPWVRSESGYARARLKHYYLARFVQPDFIRKILRGELNPIRSARALLRTIFQSLRTSSTPLLAGDAATNLLAERMAVDLQDFAGNILIILSGQDLTAKEFEDAVRDSKRWQQLRARESVSIHRLPEADHTFSRRAWRELVAAWTLAWIEGWKP
jgi:uncharacterized protein